MSKNWKEKETTDNTESVEAEKPVLTENTPETIAKPIDKQTQYRVTVLNGYHFNVKSHGLIEAFGVPVISGEVMVFLTKTQAHKLAMYPQMLKIEKV